MSAQTLSQTGPVWQEVSIDLLEHGSELAKKDPVARDAALEVYHEINTIKYRWCNTEEDLAPGNTYAGYWGIAISAADLKADPETGEIKAKNFGNVRIQWEVEFYEAHPQNTSINGATYVATGTVDENTGNFVFNGNMSNHANEQVWPVTRLGNVPPEVVEEGGKHAPVLTIGQKGVGYLIDVDYQMTQ